MFIRRRSTRASQQMNYGRKVTHSASIGTLELGWIREMYFCGSSAFSLSLSRPVWAGPLQPLLCSAEREKKWAALGKNISTSRLAELVQAHTRDPPPPPPFSRMRHTRATWPDRARLSLTTTRNFFFGFFTFWTDRCTIFILPFYFILFFSKPTVGTPRVPRSNNCVQPEWTSNIAQMPIITYRPRRADGLGEREKLPASLSLSLRKKNKNISFLARSCVFTIFILLFFFVL
jgi:hypothetical protein